MAQLLLAVWVPAWEDESRDAGKQVRLPLRWPCYAWRSLCGCCRLSRSLFMQVASLLWVVLGAGRVGQNTTWYPGAWSA
jgi:hypothetical protein